MKTLLIAALVSLSLITPTFAAEDKETITTEQAVEQAAKSIAQLLFLMESFGKQVEKELEKQREEAK